MDFIRDDKIQFLSYLNSDYKYVKQINIPYRGVQMIRDPRDIIVSSYFSHLHSHSTDGWPELEKHRKELKKLDEKEGLLATIEFMKKMPTNGYDLPIFDFMRNWNYQDENILHLRYEDFSKNSYKSLSKMLRWYGLMPNLVELLKHRMNPEDTPYIRGFKAKRYPKEELKKVIKEHSFKSVSGGRKPGQENTKSHYRKGVAGDWKNHFDKDITNEFKKTYGDIVSFLGYEKNENW